MAKNVLENIFYLSVLEDICNELRRLKKISKMEVNDAIRAKLRIN